MEEQEAQISNIHIDKIVNVCNRDIVLSIQKHFGVYASRLAVNRFLEPYKQNLISKNNGKPK